MASKGKGRKDYDHFFKMVLLGDSCVGKSCLLVRFADDEFNTNYVSTIGVDFRFRSLRHSGKKIKLQIWDTAGQERYRTITNAYYKGADGIVLVFDLFDRQSFTNLDNWLKEVENHAQPDIQIIVIANKADLLEPGNDDATRDKGSPEKVPERQVSEKEIEDFTERTGLPIFLASAKSGNGVEASFVALSEILMDKAANMAKAASEGGQAASG